MLELVEGSSISEIVGYAQEVGKTIEEEDIWMFIIQGAFMLKEFRRFGVVNCKMPADSLVWTDSKTLTYYPRSFVGIFSKRAADPDGVFYAPERSENKEELARSDIFNLGLAVMCIMKPQTEYFDIENGCFNIENIEEAHEEGVNLFGDEPVEGYSDELNAIVHDMLVCKPPERPELGRHRSRR